MNRLSVIALCGCCGWVGGCGSEPPVEQQCNPEEFEDGFVPSDTQPSAYLPVAVGNWWLYRETPTDLSATRGSQDDRKEIIGTEMLADESTFVMLSTQTWVDTGEQNPLTKRFNWRVYGNQVLRVRAEDWMHGNGDPVLVQSLDYLPGFLRISGALREVGDTLTQQFCRTTCNEVGADAGTCMTTQFTYSWSLDAVAVTKTVPAGTFTTIEIRRVDEDGQEKRFWYAEGVGKVFEHGPSNDEELLDYDVSH